MKIAWGQPVATTRVKTQHAAVNGMLNDLQKATWLMGTHLDVAYKDDRPDKYTLFHNPSESAPLDFYECINDNGLGMTTKNAKHLASVLLDIQLRGGPTKWVVHSQGGIIFKQAVKHHLKENPGVSLSKNTVVFHAGGNNKNETDQLLSAAQVKRVAPDRNNPFDMVPNLAGRNDLSAGSIVRGLAFAKKVGGKTVSKQKSPIESPHTLPYLSLESYHGFLMIAGDYKSAAKVQKLLDNQ